MRLELGVILLDDHARPVFVNSYAEKLSGACDGLLISHQAVSSLFLDDSHKLRAAISSALEFGAVHKANDLRLYPAARCYLRRRPHRLPLVIRIMPTKGSESFGEIGSLVRVVLIVFDPERSAEISWPMIAETFSLTPREAELAVLLARGADVAQAARHMHIGVETARGYLKSVQSKTQTHHQGELVSLLLRSGLHVLP
jgi:DNA-binding CsgD family transcriptional regulator